MTFVNESFIESDEDGPETLLSSNQLVEKHRCLTIGGVRWMAFKAKNDPRIRETFLRVGRRLYWKEEKLLKYLAELDQECRDKEGGNY